MDQFQSDRGVGGGQGAARPSDMFEMRFLAMEQALSLRHAPAAMPDPLGYEEGLKAYLEVLRERELAFKDRVAWLLESEAGRAEREAGRAGSLRDEYSPSPEEVAAREEDSRRFYAVKEVAKDLALREQSALRAMCESSGIWAALMEPASQEGLARICGEHVSRVELALNGSEMSNLLEGYVVKASRDERGAVSFSSPPSDIGQLSFFGRLRPQRVLSQGLPYASPERQRSVPKLFTRALWSALAPAGTAMPTRSVSQDDLVIFDQTSLASLYSSSAKEGWAAARHTLKQATAEMSPAQAAQELIARQGHDVCPWLGGMRQAVSAIERRADAIKKADKASRACAWYDQVAGQRSYELVRKVLDLDPAMQASFRTLEQIAANAGSLWAAMEGQEALGLFSIRAAAHLGLSLSGRDLADRTKAVLREGFGLSDAGWRLLGKLPSSAGGEASSGSAPGEGPAVAHWIAGWAEAERGARGPGLPARRSQSIATFCALLGAAAGKGMQPGQAESFMVAASFREKILSQLFGRPQGAPAGAPEAEAAAEAAAWSAKSPKLLASFVERFSKAGPAKAFKELELAGDWLDQAEWGLWRDLPEKPAWSDVNGRQRRWHGLVLARERGEASEVKWDIAMPGLDDPRNGLSARALADGGELWDEGKALHHCVSSYAERCVLGDSRIFSIRKDGARLGTLELARSGDPSIPWKAVQFRGPCNASIHDEPATAFVALVAQAYSKASVEAASKLAASAPKDLAAGIEGWRAGKEVWQDPPIPMAAIHPQPQP